MAEDKKKLMEAAEGELSEEALEGAAGGRRVGGYYFDDSDLVTITAPINEGNPGDHIDIPSLRNPNFGRRY